MSHQRRSIRSRLLTVLTAVVVGGLVVVPAAVAASGERGLLQRVLGLEDAVGTNDTDIAELQATVDQLTNRVAALQGQISEAMLPRLIAHTHSGLTEGLTITQKQFSDGTLRPGTYDVVIDGREFQATSCFAIQVFPQVNTDLVTWDPDAQNSDGLGTLTYSMEVQTFRLQQDRITGLAPVYSTATQALEADNDHSDALGWQVESEDTVRPTLSSSGGFDLYVWETPSTAACLAAQG